MFTLNETVTRSTATTDSPNTARLIAEALLEAIGDEGGHVIIETPAGTVIDVIYNDGEYIVNGDIYRHFYDASESVAYRMMYSD